MSKVFLAQYFENYIFFKKSNVNILLTFLVFVLESRQKIKQEKNNCFQNKR